MPRYDFAPHMTTRPKQLSGPPQIRLRASEPDRRFLRLFERRPPALELPGSRSIANRALVAAALAEGKSKLAGITACDDTLAMCEGLKALGVQIEHFPRGKSLRETWQVTGLAGGLRAPQAAIDVGASGTTARFLSAAAALADGPVTLDGSPRMRERPIEELADALCQLGARAEVLGKNGCPPLLVQGAPGGYLSSGKETVKVEVDASRSSQFASALLLIAPCIGHRVELHIRDGALVSRPFVDLTLQVMRSFGAKPDWSGNSTLVIPPVRYKAKNFTIEFDAQAAVYAFAAAAIRGDSVEAKLPGNSLQADLGVLGALQEMGCRVTRKRRSIRLHGPNRENGGGLRGIEVDGNAWPDAVLALAVVAIFAKGPTMIEGIANLRLKESNRLEALRNGLRKLGARTRVGEDYLCIEPPRNKQKLRSASLHTYDDHRMAMSLALAGLRIPKVSIRNPRCVTKTWPGFFEAPTLKALGLSVS